MAQLHLTVRSMKYPFYKTCITFVFFLLCNLSYAAQVTVDDHAAIGNLKVAKAVFLIDIGDAKKLNFYLEVIQGTYNRMVEQGVEPDFVLVYIGPSVKYLTLSPSDETEKITGNILIDVESKVSALNKLGVRQEVCSVAIRVFGIDEKSLFSDLTLVGDGFISLIGYQAQGYNLVPVY